MIGNDDGQKKLQKIFLNLTIPNFHLILLKGFYKRNCKFEGLKIQSGSVSMLCANGKLVTTLLNIKNLFLEFDDNFVDIDSTHTHTHNFEIELKFHFH